MFLRDIVIIIGGGIMLGVVSLIVEHGVKRARRVFTFPRKPQ